MTDDHENGVCHRCGAPRPDGGPVALTGVCEREPNGRAGWLCPSCARHHVRDIEARLAPEWW